MKTEVLKVYVCDYCNKVSKSKSAMIRHENFCKKNPHIKKLCYFCKHYNMSDDTITYKPEMSVYDFREFEIYKHSCCFDNTYLFNDVHMNSDLQICLLNDEENNWKQMPFVVDGCENFQCLDNHKDAYNNIKNKINE